MTKCPRCEQSIDPTTTTICPICGTDVQAANAQVAHDQNAQPQVQEPTIGGVPRPQLSVRRNLAGDAESTVQEDPPSYVIGQAPGSQKSNTPQNNAPNAPQPAGTPHRAPVSTHRTEQPAKSSTGGIVMVAILIVWLAGGGMWWKSQHRPSPKESAEKFVTALLGGDYTTAANLFAVKAGGSPTAQSVEEFKQGFQKKNDYGALGRVGTDELLKMLNAKLVKVGEPKIDGDKAKVPVEMEVSFRGQSKIQSQEFPMVWDDGKWKVDGSGKGVVNSLIGGQ